MRPSPYFLLAALAALFVWMLAQASYLQNSDSRLLGERDRANAERVQAKQRQREAIERINDAKQQATSAAMLASRERERVEASLREANSNLEEARGRVKAISEDLRLATARAQNSDLERDKLNAELLAANDRLEKAYTDIVEMERQLVDLGRKAQDPMEPLPLGWGREETKIDGTVLGVSDKVNLVLISVGAKDKVQVGYKFNVYRGSLYVSKLVVDKVEDGWAACRELTDFRKDAIQQGDNVSTRVPD